MFYVENMENERVRLIPRELIEKAPEARFLSTGEQARYDEEVLKYTEKGRDSLRIPIKGSNLFKVLLLNQIGIRTGTIPEIELAYENGLPLQGHYEDGHVF